MPGSPGIPLERNALLNESADTQAIHRIARIDGLVRKVSQGCTVIRRVAQHAERKRMAAGDVAVRAVQGFQVEFLLGRLTGTGVVDALEPGGGRIPPDRVTDIESGDKLVVVNV